MLRRFCNITGKEIEMESPMDLAPDILNLITPLQINIYPAMAKVTNGEEFVVNGISFVSEETHVRVTIMLKCEFFKQFEDKNELQDYVEALDNQLIIQSHHENTASVTIPFKVKK
ncbi:hypothetical protein [Yersinia ruckeri]|uniref:hypothetical protein n=1 Tax=Yersinia ruckeri TaxID=29486 RepID=UPI002237DC58|nr:hypothetical protein [Yersinia ruckeri]MCW6598879.1 hypothetical protein [Yersinia ruckeri]